MQSAKLGNFCEVFSTSVRLSGRSSEENFAEARTLVIKDIVSGRDLQIKKLPLVMVSEKQLAQRLRSGDVVIPSRGDHYNAWVFKGATEPVVPVGQLSVIRVNDSLDPSYLAWYLNQKSTQTKIELLLTGTNMKALTKSALLHLEVNVPPLAKQQRVGELDSVNRRIIAIRDRLNELDAEVMAYITTQVLCKGASNV